MAWCASLVCACASCCCCSLPFYAAAFVACPVTQVGEMRFYTDLFMVGLLYHLYNQVRDHNSMQLVALMVQ